MDNVVIQITVELTNHQYSLISKPAALTTLLKHAAERELYRILQRELYMRDSDLNDDE